MGLHVLRLHRARGLLLATILFTIASCDRRPAGPVRAFSLMSSIPVPSFSPTATNNIEAHWVLALVYEGLTTATESGGVQPALAVRWTTANARRWRFHLRQGVVFHDGTPFRAQHVLDSWRSALAAPPGDATHPVSLDMIDGAVAFSRGDTSGVRGVRVVDDSTLDVTLTQPYSAFAAALTSGALSVRGPGSTADHVNGTGPWRHVRGAPGDTAYGFARNTAYWAAPVRSDSLRVVVISTAPQFRAALDSGRIDCLHGAESGLPLALRTDFAMRESAPHIAMMVTINHRHPLLRQPAFRAAMDLALDRVLLARAVGVDAPVLRRSMLAPGLVPWDTITEPMPAAVARARALLRDFPLADAPPLRIAWNAGDTTVAILQTLRDQLRAVGIRTELVLLRGNVAPAFLANRVDLHLWRWMQPYPEPDAMIHGMFHSASASGLGNSYAFSDSTIDRAFDAERMMPVGPRRDSMVVALGRDLYARHPAIVLWYGSMVTGSSRRVTRCPSALYMPRYDSVGVTAAP